MINPLRAIVHVESAAGLGHHQGISQVVAAMTKNHGFDVTVVSGTFVDPQKFYPTATVRPLPDLYVGSQPPYSRWTPEGERVPYKDFNLERWQADRIRTLGDIYKEVKPHVFVTEWWPFQRPPLDPELANVHAIAKDNDIRTLFASSVRDVLQHINDPKAIAQADDRLPRIARLAKDVDAVLVHSDPHLVPFSATFPQTHIFGDDKIHHTGYVVAPMPERRAMPANQREVIVAVGSGSQGETVMDLALAAWEQSAPAFKNLTWHFITGPRYGDEKYDQLLSDLQARSNSVVCENKGLKAAPHPQFKLSEYVTNFPELVVNSAASITMGGYNTTMEVLQSRTPSVIVPKFWLSNGAVSKVDPEQESRSALLDKLGMATYVPRDRLTDARYLSATIERAVDIAVNPGPNAFSLDFNGAERSAALLRQLAERKTRGLTPTLND